MSNKAGTLKIQAVLKGSFDDVYSLLSTFPNILISKTNKSVTLSYIERKDINGNPIEFFVIEFFKNEIVISYVIPKKVPLAIRKWSVIRKSMPFLSKLADVYNINISILINLIEKTLSDMITLIPKDSKKLYIENDMLKNEMIDLERRVSSLEKERNDLASKLYDLSSKYSDCVARLRKLETYSKEELKVKIIDWIKEHDGEIDIDEFSKVYKVPTSLVEELLESLVEQSYLRPG